MTNKEFTNWRKHVLDYMTLEDIKANLKGLDYIKKGTFAKAVEMVQAGFFACYYNQCLDALKEVYADKFDESIYFTKKHEWRWRNGECCVWTVYKAKIALTVSKMLQD